MANNQRLPYLWNQGEHMTVVAETGMGKSTLMEWISRERKYKIVLRSKPDEVEWRAERTVTRAQDLTNARYNSFELRPRGERESRAKEFHSAMQYVDDCGGWTIIIDELFYVNRLTIPMPRGRQFPLEKDVEDLFTQGRSKRITVMAGLQRPVAVTRFAISQSRHVLAGAMEQRDGKELGLATTKRVEEIVPQLRDYDFLWYRRPHSLTVVRLNMETQSLEITPVG
jgi:hypothetical protein